DRVELQSHGIPCESRRRAARVSQGRERRERACTLNELSACDLSDKTGHYILLFLSQMKMIGQLDRPASDPSELPAFESAWRKRFPCGRTAQRDQHRIDARVSCP